MMFIGAINLGVEISAKLTALIWGGKKLLVTSKESFYGSTLLQQVSSVSLRLATSNHSGLFYVYYYKRLSFKINVFGIIKQYYYMIYLRYILQLQHDLLQMSQVHLYHMFQ